MEEIKTVLEVENKIVVTSSYSLTPCCSGRDNAGINFKHRARNVPPLNNGVSVGEKRAIRASKDFTDCHPNRAERGRQKMKCEKCGEIYPSKYYFKDEGRTSKLICTKCSKSLTMEEIERFLPEPSRERRSEPEQMKPNQPKWAVWESDPFVIKWFLVIIFGSILAMLAFALKETLGETVIGTVIAVIGAVIGLFVFVCILLLVIAVFILQKKCSRCGKQVPFASRAGQNCPYCGANWLGEL